MVLRRIFEPNRDEVTGEWRRLHNEELYALYSSPYIFRVIKSRRMGWAGHVARMRARREAYRVLVGRPDGKGPLGRSKPRWEDNIKIDLQGMGWGGHGLDCSGPGQGQVTGSCECGNETSGSIK
jgi:hypothetical protein